NTAGYKRKYVSFEDTLQNTIKSVSLKTSSEKHISSSSESGDERIITDNSTSTRSDGNNVDIDTEMVNLTANNMMYESLTTALNNRFAINKIARGN
ncbi:flagellar basal body rod protein FlgB, partial [uncultured Clostridium sp.]